IHDDQICSDDFAPGPLVKTAIVRAACFGCADMLFTADLAPDVNVGHNIEVADGAIFSSQAPFFDSKQLLLFRSAEKVLLHLECALKPARAEIVLPTL